MSVLKLSIADVKLVTPKKFGDGRGWFSEVYNRTTFTAAGIGEEFVQDNHSLSVVAGTLRGLHFQTPPFAQAKLVRVVRGRIFDVAVDLRRSSPTFGHHVAAELSAQNGCQLYIPIGFAHGFATLEADCEVLYKVSAPYAPAHDFGIAWDDPALAIPWPLEGRAPLLSEKDQRQPLLALCAKLF